MRQFTFLQQATKRANIAQSSPTAEIELIPSSAKAMKPKKPTTNNAGSLIQQLHSYRTNVTVIGKKRSRCGECEGCLVEEDCGDCPFCADKPKFGGPGRKNNVVQRGSVSQQ